MSTNCNSYCGNERSMEHIRERLLQYSGGAVECRKHEETGIAEIIIDNSATKNAMSGKMMVDLEAVVNDLEKWDCGKAILLYGNNDTFCSGGDLNLAKKECNADFGYDMSKFMSTTLNRLLSLPMISVAFINGTGAIGGGAEIATACDFRLMSSSDPRTKIGFVHTKMGLVPAWGGCARLVQIVGRNKALDLLLTASMLNFEEGIRIGLVDACVANFQEAYQWLEVRVQQSSSVIKTCKSCVVNAQTILNDVAARERKLFAPLWGGKDNRNALNMKIKHN